MEEQKKKVAVKQIIIKITITLLVIGVLLLAIYLICRHYGIHRFTQEELQQTIEATGIWGPLVFIIISFLQVTFIPLPSTVTIVVGSYLFGGLGSFFYSYIGIFLGSLFAFFLGKKIGRPFVNWIVGDKEVVEQYLKRLNHRENIVLFFMFLFPWFPDDILCSIAGILPVKWITFIFIQLITRATTIGGNILFLSGEIIPFSGWGIPVLITLGILSIIIFIICFKNADKINKLFDDLMQKIINKFSRKVK